MWVKGDQSHCPAPFPSSRAGHRTDPVNVSTSSTASYFQLCSLYEAFLKWKYFPRYCTGSQTPRAGFFTLPSSPGPGLASSFLVNTSARRTARKAPGTVAQSPAPQPLASADSVTDLCAFHTHHLWTPGRNHTGPATWIAICSRGFDFIVAFFHTPRAEGAGGFDF